MSFSKNRDFIGVIMGATRLQLEIMSHTLEFKRKFKVRYFTDSYLFFEWVSRYEYRSVAVYRTSAHCYRIIYYTSRLCVSRNSEYASFRSIQDLCVFLESCAIGALI